jgi:hypothetical protein
MPMWHNRVGKFGGKLMFCLEQCSQRNEEQFTTHVAFVCFHAPKMAKTPEQSRRDHQFQVSDLLQMSLDTLWANDCWVVGIFQEDFQLLDERVHCVTTGQVVAFRR